MKTFKQISIFVITLIMVQANIFSTITSRIQGTVVDELTNQPLFDVLVILHKLEVEDGEDYYGGKIEKKTDQSGNFKFDDLGKGKYFLVILTKGYSAIGPLSRVYQSLPLDLRAKFTGIFTTHSHGDDDIDVEGINTFYLKEGKIKHFNVKLKKEGVLIVKKMVKLPNKSFYLVDSRVTIKHDKFLERFPAEIGGNGEFKSNFLPAGKVRVEYGDEDNPGSTQEITLINGQSHVVEYVDDYTTGTVLHGKVVDKVTGKPLKGAAIHLRGQGEGRFSSTDQNGEFWINKIKASGTLNIKARFSYINNNNKIMSKVAYKQIIIKANILNDVQIEIGVGEIK